MTSDSVSASDSGGSTTVPVPPHAGRRSSSSGRAVQSTSSGVSVVHSSNCSMKSSSATSAQCRSSKTSTSGARPASSSMNRLHAANASTCRSPPSSWWVSSPTRGRSSRSIQSATAGSSAGLTTARRSLALAVSASSEWRIPASAFTISASAQKVTPSPYGSERPLRYAICSGSASRRARNSATSRLLPIPGSPTRVTRRGVRVCRTEPSADQSSPSCACRPTSGKPASGSSAPGDLASSAIHTPTGSRFPFRVTASASLYRIARLVAR